MTEIYFIIVGFLLLLAVFDLFVGVSNDAVNFLNSAIGAKVAKFKTVMFVAAFGVLLGALMSSGMMDVARHGIMQPSHYSFQEVMTIFLAVMVTDVVILDVFNSLGMPTSTTVSLVFELLGATFVTACIKMLGDDTLTLNMLLNSEKALSVIIAIFVSVAIAFAAGIVVQWVLRLAFTFDYKRRLTALIGVFGGVAFTALAYFILIKGLGKSPFITGDTRSWIDANTDSLLLGIFIGTTILSQLLHFLKVNVLRLIVLLGTFALAMAFAGNDLVNFIGVPLAGLDSLLDFLANGNGDLSGFMMTSLQASAKSPLIYLLIAGCIMVFAMVTSKKAQNVVKTSVDLARQDEGEEMFGSSRVARSIVRASQNIGSRSAQIIPKSIRSWVGKRFNKEEAILAEGAAFDELRAAVNLVLAALLIIMGTTMKLPLSTTYVTFMVAMGSSLADRAWGRESAVYRITGVLSVIGGWFVTAGMAFMACGIVCTIMYYGSYVAMFGFMALALYLLYRSNVGEKTEDTNAEAEKAQVQLMLRAKDREQTWLLLRQHFIDTQTNVINLVSDDYKRLVSAMEPNDLKALRKIGKNLRNANRAHKRNRRLETIALRRSPMENAIERNTWFHLAHNSNKQFIYCLSRMLEPLMEHVDNGFTPMPKMYINEYNQILQRVEILMNNSNTMIRTVFYKDYHETMDTADRLKNELSVLRKKHIDRIQREDRLNLTTSQLYLNLIQETQELLSIMRHQLRATKRFTQQTTTTDYGREQG